MKDSSPCAVDLVNHPQELSGTGVGAAIQDVVIEVAV